MSDNVKVLEQIYVEWCIDFGQISRGICGSGLNNEPSVQTNRRQKGQITKTHPLAGTEEFRFHSIPRSCPRTQARSNRRMWPQSPANTAHARKWTRAWWSSEWTPAERISGRQLLKSTLIHSVHLKILTLSQVCRGCWLLKPAKQKRRRDEVWEGGADVGVLFRGWVTNALVEVNMCRKSEPLGNSVKRKKQTNIWMYDCTQSIKRRISTSNIHQIKSCLTLSLISVVKQILWWRFLWQPFFFYPEIPLIFTNFYKYIFKDQRL